MMKRSKGSNVDGDGIKKRESIDSGDASPEKVSPLTQPQFKSSEVDMKPKAKEPLAQAGSDDDDDDDGVEDSDSASDIDEGTDSSSLGDNDGGDRNVVIEANGVNGTGAAPGAATPASETLIVPGYPAGRGIPKFPAPAGGTTQAGRILTPSRFDVLFGRGKPYQSHFGNLRLHKLVKRQKLRYTTARRHEKLTIATEVVNAIKKSGAEPSRFLKRSPTGGHWVEVSDFIARQKVGHALRGKPRMRKRGSLPPEPQPEMQLPEVSQDPRPVEEEEEEARPTEAVSNPTVQAAIDHVTEVDGASARIAPMSNTSTSSWQPPAPPQVDAMNELEERHRLLTHIAELDTETLAEIVRQHCSGAEDRRASHATLSLASSIPPSAAIGPPHLPLPYFGSLPPSTLSALTSRWLPPSGTHGDMPPDPQLLAALMQTNGIHGQLPGSGEHERNLTDPRLLAAYMQQGRYPPYF